MLIYDPLNCLKWIEIFFPVSFSMRRYDLQKNHRKILNIFGRKSFSKKNMKNIFLEKLKILKIFQSIVFQLRIPPAKKAPPPLGYRSSKGGGFLSRRH